MTQKKSRRNKTAPKEVPEKKVAVEKAVTSPKGPKPLISTLDEAKELVEKSYKTSMYLEYTVLSNGHVFYGINAGAARSYARKFGLETFDVKF